ncbi:restriction endonuclease subunit S [Nocardia nepalensis]|uniref:restriction endonuclease subunit S n=1 Tax=Nocardia nepalensis TaxID=3375448 RepID=UPI003B66CA76
MNPHGWKLSCASSWAGLVAEWNRTTVGEVITLQRGFDITRATQRAGNVPVVSSGGVSSFHDTAAVTSPGVVMGRKGTLGKVFYLDCDFWPHDTTLWVKDFKGNNPRFVYYFLTTLNFLAMDVGSSNPTLNRNHVHPVPILWPPLLDQNAIASVLGALDDKISSNDRIVDTAERLGSAAFERYFGCALDCVTTNDQLPDGWRLSDLGAVSEVIETGRRPKGGVAGIDSGVPSIGAESIIRLGEFDFSKVKYVPEDFYSKMARGILKSGDVLVYKDGGRPGDFRPHVSMFGNGYPFERMCINEHVYRVRLDRNLGQNFGYYWLSSTPILAEMRRRGTGAAIPGINSTAMKGIPVVVPPADRLSDFEVFVGPLVNRVLSAASESRTLATIRDALLPQLISGKLRIRDAEQIVENVV